MRNATCAMRNAAVTLLVLTAGMPTRAASDASAGRTWGQTQLDQVVLRFGGEIVTRLDVRQVRLLKLVDVPADTDEAYIDAIANRRLMLADLKRANTEEPAADALEASVRAWTARVGGGDVAGLLTRAGLTDAGLRAWLKDDLRLQKYVSDRFAGRPADQAAWLSTLRQRAGLR